MIISFQRRINVLFGKKFINKREREREPERGGGLKYKPTEFPALPLNWEKKTPFVFFRSTY